MRERTVIVTHKTNRVRFEITAYKEDHRSDSAIRREAKAAFQAKHKRVKPENIQSTIIYGFKIINEWAKRQQ